MRVDFRAKSRQTISFFGQEGGRRGELMKRTKAAMAPPVGTARIDVANTVILGRGETGRVATTTWLAAHVDGGGKKSSLDIHPLLDEDRIAHEAHFETSP